jgi:MFS family permease
MLTNGAYMGGFILTPLLLEDVLGYGPTRTGLISIFRPLAFAITGPLVGAIAVRAGERNVARIGALFVGGSMITLSMVGEGTTDVFIAGGLALSGIGMGATQPSMVATIANAVDENDLGVAGAAQQMLTQIGTVGGIQLLQTTQMVTEERSGLTGSYGNAYLLGAVLAAAGAVTASFIASSNRPAPARRLRRHEREAPAPACRAA